MSIAIYPGSFDPVTLGHLNIIKRASACFDKVIVCVMINSKKQGMFTPEEREALMEAVAENKKTVTVPCTACRYCSDCPKGIDIPGIFNLYNRFRLSGFRGGFAGEYAKLPEEKKAENCIECGICAGHCPQHIAIPEKLKEIRQEMLS